MIKIPANYLITLVFSFAFLSVQSQYKWGLGLKANDNYGGVNVKAFIDELNAVDITVHVDANGGRGLIVLYKRQNRFPKSKELYWFYGGGPQAGYWRVSSTEIKARYGIDGVIGMEYVPQKYSLSFAIEYIPGYTIGDGGGSLELSNWTLAVRYTFK